MGSERGTKASGLGAKSRMQFGWFCRQVRGGGLWEGPGGCGGKEGVGVGVAWDPEAWEAGVHQAKLHVCGDWTRTVLQVMERNLVNAGASQ